MLHPTMQASLLHMLHTQYRYYTTELGETHKQLGVQYGKIAAAELELMQRHEKAPTRQDKKRLQWTKCQAKYAIKSLESQQTWLHDYLRQCNALITSCGAIVYGSTVTPCGALLPLDPLSPMSGLTTPGPWSAHPLTVFQYQQQQTPQYWDLSMLSDRRESSPFAPSWSADSGFYEMTNPDFPNEQSFRNPFSNDPELDAATAAPQPYPSSRKSSISERDDEVPELVEPASPTRSSASTHKRRFSENAIQLIESRLSLPNQTHHQHGHSASATPLPQRRRSAHPSAA